MPPVVVKLLLISLLLWSESLGAYLKQKFVGSGAHVDRQFGFETEPCDPLPPERLAKILGAAFNPRYMSVGEPPDGKDVHVEGDDSASAKRDASASFRPFSVDEGFAHQLTEADDVPAWEVDHFASDYFSAGRSRRSPSPQLPKKPWECKSIVKWIDLGADYFPRYMRNVECERHSCWYGMYQCRPKSFTVKMLRRREGRCAHANKRDGVHGLPDELKELWVWEERAVNFCCECAAS